MSLPPSPPSGARILLTGGAGYIGSHTFVALRAAGHEPVILDSFANARVNVPEHLGALTGAPVAVIRADVRDRAALDAALGAQRFDAVIHFAALKSVGESVRAPLHYAEVNIGGLVTLLQAMQAAGVRRIVYSSSATVYAEDTPMPLTEAARLGGVSGYAFTKRAGEEILARLAASEPGWQIGVLRYFNPAGAHPSGLIGEDPAGVPANLVPYLAQVARGDLPMLRVFGTDWPTPDGSGVRDYIHVMDLAEGHVASVAALLGGDAGHVLNLGTGRGASVFEVLGAYEAAVGRPLPWVAAPRRPGDLAAYWADPSRAEALLGFRAHRTLAEICASSWAFARARG